MKTKQTFSLLAIAILVVVYCTLQISAQNTKPLTRLPVVAPEQVGMDAKILTQIDAEVQKALTAKNMPGCVVCIGRHEKIAYLKAFGNKQVATEMESAQEMTTNTVFDLASLTKPLATATSIMVLVDQGNLSVDDKVSQYFDEFQTPEKQNITVRQLMTHTAGFMPDNHISDYQDGTTKAAERLLALKPTTKPGTDFTYSDVSFELLGLLVEKISGKNVADFALENIYQPLGMTETMYVPNDELSQRAAPTQKRELGKVHDPRAFLMNGIAGHAGLFSTAEDMAVYAAMMLNKGCLPENLGQLPRILKAETVTQMTERNRVPGGYRGLGWDMRTGFSSNRGQSMSPAAYGHGGFTGTSMWIDPGNDLFVIFLSNRVHPDGKGSVNTLAGRLGTIAVNAITDTPKEQ
ncbi:MAG: beta-lactamase family protein [Planctomycetaceae bacterium]|jgi:CubicO group peptidase (beta-lactamase class C family)|nr:beta-lactamase family protein [Planctomycetaceae bacterium]